MIIDVMRVIQAWFHERDQLRFDQFILRRSDRKKLYRVAPVSVAMSWNQALFVILIKNQGQNHAC